MGAERGILAKSAHIISNQSHLKCGLQSLASFSSFHAEPFLETRLPFSGTRLTFPSWRVPAYDDKIQLVAQILLLVNITTQSALLLP